MMDNRYTVQLFYLFILFNNVYLTFPNISSKSLLTHSEHKMNKAFNI